MTRSRRHTPKLALGGDASEKQDRARAHRKERHAVKTRLTQFLDADGAKIEHKRSGHVELRQGRQALGRGAGRSAHAQVTVAALRRPRSLTRAGSVSTVESHRWPASMTCGKRSP